MEFGVDLVLISAAGTVLVAIGTKEGFVLAADTLEVLTDERGNEIRNEEKEKIYRLAKFVGCQLAGRLLNVCIKSGYRYEYNLNDIFERYSAQFPHGLTVSLHTMTLATLIYKALQNFYSRCPEKLLELRAAMKGHQTMITVHLVGYDDGMIPSLHTIIFPPQGKQVGSNFQLSNPIIDSHNFSTTSELYFVGSGGASEVVEALKDKNSDLYAEFRQSTPLTKYYTRLDTHTEKDMTLTEGIELAKVLVDAAIKHTPRELKVGGKVQVAVVEPQTGFRWIFEPSTSANSTHC